MNLSELYSRNGSFRRYVDQYCGIHRCTTAEAFKQALVYAVGRKYTEQEAERDRKRLRPEIFGQADVR